MQLKKGLMRPKLTLFHQLINQIMKRKRYFLLVLALALTMTTTSWAQNTTRNEIVDGLVYSYTDGRTDVAVQSYTDDWNGIVPDKVTLGGMQRPVTVIYNNAFAGYTGTSITIKAPLATVESRYGIGTYAFYNCKNLETVTFEGAVGELFNEIREYTFYGCSSLKKVNLPATITNIEAFAFGSCQALEDLGPNGLKNVRYLRERAFEDCIGLRGKTISLPNLICAVDKPFTGIGDLTIDLRENEGIPASDGSLQGYTVLVKKGTGDYYRLLWKTQYSPDRIVDEMDDEIGKGYRLWDLNNDGVVNMPDAQMIIDKIIGK